MTINKTNQEFRTSDLALAVTLSLSFPLEDIDFSKPRKAEFVFERTPELTQHERQYWTRKITVEPQAFYNQLRAVKARLFS